jgi:hypothetical protein
MSYFIWTSGTCKLTFTGSANRASACARTAVDALTSVDHILTVTFSDSANRTFSSASSAADASILNYISHSVTSLNYGVLNKQHHYSIIRLK